MSAQITGLRELSSKREVFGIGSPVRGAITREKWEDRGETPLF